MRVKLSGIYKIQSIIKPNQCYVGSAIDINIRWWSHLNQLKKNKHPNKKLQNHFNKYGKNDLIFSIIIGCEKDDLITTEQFFIDSIKPYFNICKIAGSKLGCKHSEETKQKMRGKKMSIEAKEKISKSLIGTQRHLGHKHTLETIDRIKEARKNQIFTKESIEKRNKSNKDLHRKMKHSEETINKIKIARAKQVFTEEINLKRKESIIKAYQEKKALLNINKN